MRTMGAMLSPAAMNSDGQGRACHVSVLCMGVGEGPSSSSQHQGYLLQLLLKPKFSGVEKIKTIGSTYMAAAGLSAPSGHENQVLQACVKVNPIGHPQSYHLLKALGAEAFCGIAWRPWWGQKPLAHSVRPQSRLHGVGYATPCPAGPGAEARAHRSLGRI